MRLKFTLLLIAIVGIFLFFRSKAQLAQNQLETIPTVTSTISPEASPKQGIQSSWIQVDDVQDISLHSNLEEKLSALEFKEKHQCESIVNGGFYTKENAHIGLFVEDGKELSKYQENSLFNGFFSIVNNVPRINQTQPMNPDIALQTGPILRKNSQKHTLSITRDENARRMVAAITPEKKILFVTFYDASSLVLGPKLEELPKYVEEFAQSKSYSITDAINLDGGSHSAFISEEIQLTDIQTAGSYFCVKN